MAQQILVVHFDAQFIVARPADDDLSHSRKSLQIISNLANRTLERLIVSVTRDSHLDDRQVWFEFCHPNAIGLDRQICQ